MKTLHVLLATFSLLVVGHLVPAASAEPVTFYVAPGGNDAWSGRAAEPNAAENDGPFATLGRAQEALRALRSDGVLPGPVTVRIRGTHRLTEPLVITPDDSGTAECSVTFTGYEGERPILSGGRPITGWQEGQRGVWTVEIPEGRAIGVKTSDWWQRLAAIGGSDWWQRSALGGRIRRKRRVRGCCRRAYYAAGSELPSPDSVDLTEAACH